MKINHLFTFIILYISTFSFAQKADIDPHYVSISLAQLPANYIAEDNRSFSVKSYGNFKYVGGNFDEQIHIYGWKKVADGGTILVKPRLGNFTFGGADARSQKHETKDKDGKVISTKTTYSYAVNNSGDADLEVYGPKNEIPKFVKVSKSKPKELSKKEKELAANPFLKGVETKAIEVSGSSDGEKALAYKANLDQSFSYETGQFDSSREALKSFNANVHSASANHESDFNSHLISSINRQINSEYGYAPRSFYVKFKKLDTDKHPEHDMYKNATVALKAIFERMRYNQSISSIESDLIPIMDYFEGVVKKYNSADDKGQRKLKAATLFNLAKICQYLDRHDKAIEYANVMISSKLEEDDAEDIINESNEIKHYLNFHKMSTRHIVPFDDKSREDNLGESDKKEEEKP